MGGAGKGPGIGWSRVQPKYSREANLYRLVLQLNFIVTVELLYDQAESDFVQCQTKMRAFASRICSEFKQIGLN